MKPIRLFQNLVAFVATLPLIAPGWMQSAQAADPPTTPPVARPIAAARPITAAEVRPMDVVLAANNVLVGQVLDAQGTAVAETDVIVTQGKQEVARTLTNEFGEFAVTLPRGGLYVVFSNRSAQIVRTWTAAAAPPMAADRAVLAERDEVIRAQFGGNLFGGGAGWIYVGVIAAIAGGIGYAIYRNNRNEIKAVPLPASP